MDPSAYNIPTEDLFRLKDRTILITGGLGGVGSAVTSAILESGGDVACFDLSKDPQNLGTFHAIAEKHRTRFYYFSVNVTDAAEVSRAMADVVAAIRFPLRGVVTAAGNSGEVDAADYPPEAFRKLLDVNVMGTFLVVQAAAKLMMVLKLGGSVVLIASMSGTVANKGVHTSAYNSSKAAVQQLARSLAAEWGNQSGSPPIRVNSVSPGYIYTQLTVDALARPEVKAQWTGDNMLGRISHPEEYRAPILFLLGDGSSFMTGADLRYDGGHTAW